MDPSNHSIFLAHRHSSLEWKRHESLENMRHKTEYDMLCTLGRGAYGTTYKVKNRVDSHIYAMKSVRLASTAGSSARVVHGGTDLGGSGIDCGTSTSTNQSTASKHHEDHAQKVLREVQVLSSISNNDHIVRYYGAFVEKGDKLLSASFESDDDDGDSSWSVSNVSLSSTTASTKNGSSNNYPVCDRCKSSYKDWEVSFENWGLLDAILQPLNLCTACYLQSVPPDVDTSTINIREKQVLPLYLFILMEYCESTLMEAVNQLREDHIHDNTLLERSLWSFFGQCVQGLAHLHSKGFIHRDIKPHNIFVHEGVVKLGDLGLATSSSPSLRLLASSDKDAPSQSQMNINGAPTNADYTQESKSSQVGTYLYVAPEVSSGKYDERCDIYSLGVVLLELFHPFSTGMERAKVLGEVRSSHGSTLPETWPVTNSIQARLVQQMLSLDPSQRPSCQQLLVELSNHGLYEVPSARKTDDTIVITNLQQQVQDLTATLKRKDDMIDLLRELLDKHGIAHGYIR